jgi:hypothetical protein
MHTTFISPLKYMYIKHSLLLYFAHMENHEIHKTAQKKATRRQMHRQGLWVKAARMRNTVMFSIH